MKQRTKICWQHLNAPPSTPDFTGKEGLNLWLGQLHVGDLNGVGQGEGP